MKRLVSFMCVFSIFLLNISIVSAQNSWVISEDDPGIEYMRLEDDTVRIRIQAPAGKQDMFFIPGKVDGYTVSVAWMQDMGLYAKALVLPNTIRTIEPYALSGYYEELYLPEGLEVISGCAVVYSDCPLTGIVIPTTVTTIEETAFYYATGGVPGSMAPAQELTVYSLGNVAAQDYAQRQGYKYVDLSEFARGDMDLNATTNTMDALTVLSIASGDQYGTAVHRVMADVDRNDTINMMDALLVYREASGE